MIDIRFRKCQSCGKNRIYKARGFCSTCYTRLNRQGKIPVRTPSTYQKHFLSNINPLTKTANCAFDGVVKIQPRNKDHSKWSCSISTNNRTRLWKIKKRAIKKEILKKQCEVCGKSNVRLCWDHRHSGKEKYWDNLKYDIKEFRGTLCNNCNMAIGLMKDNPIFFYRAYKYLKRSI